jgi:hypothetical protein
VERQGDFYLVDASLIERLRKCLKKFEHQQDVCNAHALQKQTGGKFEDCLREAKEVRRCAHVKAAIADSRIEGYPPPSPHEQAILDEYIRGEIEAADLVTAYRKRNRKP